MSNTLSLQKKDFEAKTGVFLGYGRGAEFSERAWTTKQAAVVVDCVESGLRQFYYPPRLPGEAESYNWSFLRPYAQVTLLSGERTIKLPDDFGGLEGRIIVTSSDGTHPVIEQVNEGIIKQLYAEDSDATGHPQKAALSPQKGTSHSGSSVSELLVYPEADEDYTLEFAYYLHPDALTGARPYAYGGTEHVETILESCLMIAEERQDDARTVHAMKFMERLAASVSLDRRHKAQTLGYNGDRSDLRSWGWRRAHTNDTVVTFDGVEYS